MSKGLRELLARMAACTSEMIFYVELKLICSMKMGEIFPPVKPSEILKAIEIACYKKSPWGFSTLEIRVLLFQKKNARMQVLNWYISWKFNSKSH